MHVKKNFKIFHFSAKFLNFLEGPPVEFFLNRFFSTSMHSETKFYIDLRCFLTFGLGPLPRELCFLHDSKFGLSHLSFSLFEVGQNQNCAILKIFKFKRIRFFTPNIWTKFHFWQKRTLRLLIKIEFLQIILSIKLFEPHRSSAADFFMFYNGEQQ